MPPWRPVCKCPALETFTQVLWCLTALCSHLLLYLKLVSLQGYPSVSMPIPQGSAVKHSR